MYVKHSLFIMRILNSLTIDNLYTYTFVLICNFCAKANSFVCAIVFCDFCVCVGEWTLRIDT